MNRRRWVHGTVFAALCAAMLAGCAVYDNEDRKEFDRKAEVLKGTQKALREDVRLRSLVCGAVAESTAGAAIPRETEASLAPNSPYQAPISQSECMTHLAE